MRIMPFMKRKKGVQFAGIGIDSGGGGSSIPIASPQTLGGVKIGDGLSITNEGVLSALSSGGLPDFSSSEQLLGCKWVDGKDLYIRTLTGVKTANNVTIPLGAVGSFDMIMVAFANFKNESGLTYFITDDSYTVNYESRSGNANIVISSNTYPITYNVVVIYTKN